MALGKPWVLLEEKKDLGHLGKVIRDLKKDEAKKDVKPPLASGLASGWDPTAAVGAAPPPQMWKESKGKDHLRSGKLGME